MSKKSIPAKQLLSLATLLLAVLGASCTRENSEVITIGSGSQSGIYKDLAASLARTVNNSGVAPGFKLTDELSAGSVANINALSAGEIQFGIAQADDQFHAVNGARDWAASGPQAGLRAVFSIYPETLTLIAGGDVNIKTLADVAGKRVDIGLPGSGTRRNAVGALKVNGINWQNDFTATETSLDNRLQTFMEGGIDAFFYTTGHPSTEIKMATFSVRQARLIDIPVDPALLDGLPYYSITSIPAGTYPESLNQEDTLTVGVRATLLTTAATSEAIVYAVTKAAFENAEALSKLHPQYKALLEENFLDGLSAPLHPGAAKYYREIGINVP